MAVEEQKVEEQNMKQPLRVSEDGYVKIFEESQVLEILLDREHRRNALSVAMCEFLAEEITAAAQRAEQEDALRVIVIRSTGSVFCSGADLGSRKEAESGQGSVYDSGFDVALDSLLTAITHATIPVVADIRGAAIGAGVQLALACDLRIISAEAWFWVPATRHGFALDAWTIRRSVELLGGSMARNLLMGDAKITSTQALGLGFASKLCANDSEAEDYLEGLAQLAPLSVAYFKQALNNLDALESPAISKFYHQCWKSQDVSEARQARREKRQPNFHRH